MIGGQVEDLEDVVTPEDRSILRIWCFAALASVTTLFEYYYARNLAVAAFVGLYVSLLSSGLLASAISTMLDEPEVMVFAIVGAVIYVFLYCLYRFYWG